MKWCSTELFWIFYRFGNEVAKLICLDFKMANTILAQMPRDTMEEAKKHFMQTKIKRGGGKEELILIGNVLHCGTTWTPISDKALLCSYPSRTQTWVCTT